MPFLKSLVDTCIYRSDPPSRLHPLPPHPTHNPLTFILSPRGGEGRVRGMRRRGGGLFFHGRGALPAPATQRFFQPVARPAVPGIPLEDTQEDRRCLVQESLLEADDSEADGGEGVILENFPEPRSFSRRAAALQQIAEPRRLAIRRI